MNLVKQCTSMVVLVVVDRVQPQCWVRTCVALFSSFFLLGGGGTGGGHGSGLQTTAGVPGTCVFFFSFVGPVASCGGGGEQTVQVLGTCRFFFLLLLFSFVLFWVVVVVVDNPNWVLAPDFSAFLFTFSASGWWCCWW